MELTRERLKELLKYDKWTGVFRWKVQKRNGTPPPGAVAGCLNEYGYVIIGIDKKHYKAHRLAWLYAFGSFPEKDIDHIDGNKSNNAIANIREVTAAENRQNLRKAKVTSSTGILGVIRSGRKYRAEISHNGKPKKLGRFNTPEEAHAAYLKAKRELHPFCTI